MRKSFLPKKIATSVLVLAVFCLLFTSCTNLLEGLGIPEIEDYWRFDRFEEEDRELIKGKWVLKKIGSECWNDADNPYVDTENVQQISRIESLNIDFEGEHMILTFNFTQPTLIDNWYFTGSGPIQSEYTWVTSFTVPHGKQIKINWESSSTVGGSNYDYNGEAFTVYNMEEESCACSDYYFNCLYNVKNVITDEKGEIKRLIMNYYPSSDNYYDYEFEREN